MPRRTAKPAGATGRRTRFVLAFAATAFVLTAGAGLFSVWWTAMWTTAWHSPPDQQWPMWHILEVGCERGRFSIGWASAADTHEGSPGHGLFLQRYPPAIRWWFTFDRTLYFGNPSARHVAIPFWFPLALIAAVGARAWRRRARPGHCPVCGYSLRGVPAGPCPECGTLAGT